MNLTDKHITYENNCRQLLIGQTIRGIIYEEVNCYMDDSGRTINPEPLYKTAYKDVNTIDLNIYFKTDQKTIQVLWDNTFTCYGLISIPIDRIGPTNEYGIKWDVSSEHIWKEVVGQKIVDFNILWKEVSSSNYDGTDLVYIIYPQSFEIKIANGQIIILSAAEIDTKDGELLHLSDNILATTNTTLAKQLNMI